MKKKSRGNRGQFSIIAALLVSVILVAAVVMTYSTIRHGPIQESPKVLTSIGEMNSAIKRILDFTVGYYGSILQVTGNTTYAKNRAASYLRSGLVNIARSHPEWNPSFDLDFQRVSTVWFMPESYSMGNISLTYSLSGLGIQGVKYETSSLLRVTILEPANTSEARVMVMREDNEPELRLETENFFFYNYSYSDSTWKLVNSESDPALFSNGTYVLEIPSGVDQGAYSIQVVDPRGIMVKAFYSEVSLASGIPQYAYTFDWNATGKEHIYSSLSRDTIVVEALQNGTLRWLGQNLQLSTQGKPILPLPVKALHINRTINGLSQQVPFQVEDWGSNYRVPLGLTSNASVFKNRNMLVFLANHNVEKVTLWWNGSDIANQTSYAWKNRYFNDDPDASPNYGVLNNGFLRLRVYNFRIRSTVVGGTTTSTTEFMRINGDDPTYGAKPAYVIYNGIVRDIIQQEAEWSGGVPNCPNVYSQIVLTLPANATYYTYALRLIFVNSAQSRTITDLSAIQLSSERISGLQSFTQNGTSGSFPIVVETYADENNLFYNFSDSQTGGAHHWSEYVKESRGAGIMFTDNSNMKLYTFDSIPPGQKRGALDVTNDENYWGERRVTIEFNPVAQSQASFTYPHDVTWHGAVVTFEDEPIYPSSGGNIGLWVIVEHPPVIAVS